LFYVHCNQLNTNQRKQKDNMKFQKLALVSAIALALTACGGGGGGGSSPSLVTAGSPVTPVVAVKATPLKIYPTSYENRKILNAIELTGSQYAPNINFSANADFFQRGKLDVFTSITNQFPDQVTMPWDVVKANPAKYASDMQFWQRDDAGNLTLKQSYRGCFNPRKVLVADFNQDGIPDVLVACHGYDGPPLPGEKNTLLLSNKNGTFDVSEVGEVGFYHGASAADVNGDGYPDIVVTNYQNFNGNGKSVYWYINNKDGTFTKDEARVPNVGRSYFTTEATDVDGDGNIDLIIGGTEPSAEVCKCGDAPTQILYGDSHGMFFGNHTTIAPVTGRGIALDFTLVNGKNGDKYLYVGRTGDGTDPTAPYYTASTLQAFNITRDPSTPVLPTDKTQVLVDLLNVDWIPGNYIPVTVNGVNGVTATREWLPQIHNGILPSVYNFVTDLY
jgi:hypothetical protein